jgi:nitrous oxide reductase accessory protein NosL
MGDDLIPFGEREDADAFAGEYGGDVVEYDAVTPELVGQIGR